MQEGCNGQRRGPPACTLLRPHTPPAAGGCSPQEVWHVRCAVHTAAGNESSASTIRTCALLLALTGDSHRARQCEPARGPTASWLLSPFRPFPAAVHHAMRLVPACSFLCRCTTCLATAATRRCRLPARTCLRSSGCAPRAARSGRWRWRTHATPTTSVAACGSWECGRWSSKTATGTTVGRGSWREPYACPGVTSAAKAAPHR